MKANKEYNKAKEFTYVEFPQKFVWKDVELNNGSISGKKKVKN